MKGSIFIHGILQRTGTNLLNRILLLHPHCIQPVVKIRENWLLHNSDPLYKFTGQLFQSWSNPLWGGDEFSRSDLYSTLGNTLLDYLGKNIPDISEKFLLSKTPDVKNLCRFFELFPTSKLVIIVRNPLDVATSAYNSWHQPVDVSLRKWDEACKAINDFENISLPDQYLIIRFEDLVADVQMWARKCIDFLKLNESLFPWQFLDKLPIYGTSEEAVWKVKDSNETFQPIGRWKNLPSDQLEKLHKTHCNYNKYFGYPDFPSDQILLMPTRENRLHMATRLNIKIPPDSSLSISLCRRTEALKTGLRLITEAVFGENMAALLRKSDVKNKDIFSE